MQGALGRPDASCVKTPFPWACAVGAPARAAVSPMAVSRPAHVRRSAEERPIMS